VFFLGGIATAAGLGRHDGSPWSDGLSSRRSYQGVQDGVRYTHSAPFKTGKG
jgi:hypothetical protein